MSEPTFEQLKGQIRGALAGYREKDPRAAMLSGISLAATFLAKLEGSKTIGPQTVATAAGEVATEMGLLMDRIDKRRRR